MKWKCGACDRYDHRKARRGSEKTARDESDAA